MPDASLAYALTMVAALVVCSLLLRRTQRSLPLTSQQKMGIGLGAFCGAMIGAKLPFMFADWQGMLSGAAWLAHGKTIMCGIVGGYLGVEFSKWALNIQVKTGDTFAAPVAVAVAMGRLGCFQAGCCYGTPTKLPWGIVFPTATVDAALPRHPTQLYEAMFHATAALVLILLARRRVFRGNLMKLYLLSYLGYRFISEAIRPEARLLWGLTGYQWAALALAPVFIWLWVRDRRLSSPLPDLADSGRQTIPDLADS